MVEILVMGGSRFIGKHLLAQLATDTENHIVVINRGSVPNENYLPGNAVHLSVDRADRDAMKQALSGRSFDFVYDVSVQSSQHVEILLDSLESPPKRHVHVSTGGVYNIYGEDPPVYWLPIAEDFEIGPINETEHPYVVAKRAAEKILFEAHQKEHYPVVIVRPTFVYGPDNYLYREAYFFDRIIQDRPVLLPNGGHSVTDLVYVDDVAALMIHCAHLPDEHVLGRAFNATKGDGITQNMLVKLIASIIDKTPEVLYFDPKELMAMNWPVEKFMYPYIAEGASYFSSRIIEQELGFTGSVDYRTGLQAAFEWWNDHGEKHDDFELENALISYIRASTEEEQQKSKQDLVTLVEKIQHHTE